MNRQPNASAIGTNADAPHDLNLESRNVSGSGRLIINADDWGRDRNTTDRTLECHQEGSLSSVSAMVYMQDSERAAALAHEHQVDTGLHLNLSEPHSSPDCPPRVKEHQKTVADYLRRFAMIRVLYNPLLSRSLQYVVESQIEEYARLYGSAPGRIDGHHHLHLCSNIVLCDLLPADSIVRRNFTFRSGEKSWLNLAYRKFIDDRLAKRYTLVDRLYPLPPLEPVSRLQSIIAEARDLIVEVETHPVNTDEYRFLRSKRIFEVAGDVVVEPRFSVPRRSPKTGLEN